MTVTDPDINRRVSQNTNDIKDVYDKLTKVEKTQDVHTAMLGERAYDAGRAHERSWPSTRPKFDRIDQRMRTLTGIWACSTLRWRRSAGG